MAELVLPSGAIKVIQTQQNMVGGTIAGGAGSVTNNVSNTDNAPLIGVLEQIREVSLKSFRGITRVATLLADTLNFEKANARRERDQAAELAKENKIKAGSTVGVKTKTEVKKDDEGGFDIGAGGGFLAGLGLTPLIKKAKDIIGKIIRPFSNLLASLGRLTGLAGTFTRLAPLLAPLGPVGLIASALLLIVQYSDELAKALSPVIDGLKRTFELLKPIFEPIMFVADLAVKLGLTTIGGALGVAVEGLNSVLGGLLAGVIFINDLIRGLVTGDMNLIANAWKTVKATFQSLGDRFINAIKSLYNGIIDSLPLPEKIKNKIKLDTTDKSKTEEVDVSPAEKSDITNQASMARATTDTSTTNEVSKIEEPKAETIPEEKPKVMNVDKTASVVQVAEKITGDPNLPPLGMNMYNTTGDTWEERAKQWQDFKAALVQAEKDGTMSKEELDFRIMKMMDEKDRLKRAKRVIGIKKQKAELTGQQFDEASALGEMDADNAETQQRVLAESGMTVQSFDEALNNKLKPNVNKRNLTGDGASGQGNVTVVNNQPQNISSSTNVAKTSVSSGPINTSSGDSYFDRQAYNVGV